MAGYGNGYRITNLVGEFIKDKDLLGAQDPFVVFESGSTKVNTKVVKSGGTNPIWEDEYFIEPDTTGVNSELHIAVYNKNTLLPDQLLGRGNVTLDNGMKTVTLVDKKGNTTGQLTFSLSGGSGMGGGVSGTHGAGHTHSGVAGSDHSGSRGVSTGAGVGTGAAMGAGMGAGAVHHEHGILDGDTRTHHEHIPGGERTVTNTTTVTEERGVGDKVCDAQTFVKTEDRPTVREVKNYILEHRPVEKEYIVETKFVGEKHLGVSHTEHINSEENIVQTTPAKPPCADAPTLDTLTEGNGYQRTKHTNACADGTCGI